MSHGPDDDPVIKGVEYVVDYEELYAERLHILQQQMYEFRAAQGVKDDKPDIGVFARHKGPNGSISYTARSAHAGHLTIEYPGRSVTLDFSKPEITLEIVVDGQHASIDANAAGISVLHSIQQRLAELEQDSLRLED